MPGQDDGHALPMLIQIAFRSEYFSSACIDLSRPKPDCLKPPNGDDEVAGVEAVDPDDAGAERAGEPMRARDVARPDAGGQAVDGVVRDPNRLLLVA